VQSQNLPDAASGREVEGTSHSELSERSRFKITPEKAEVLFGLGVLKLVVVGIIVTHLVGGSHFHSNANNPIHTTQPTSSTQPNATPLTSPPQPTPTIPPRAFAER
jgi:hypothetical protein